MAFGRSRSNCDYRRLAVRRWATILFLAATACGGGATADLSPRPLGLADPVAIAPAGTAAPATTAVAPPTTVATPAVTEPPPPGLRVGAEGPAVLALEQKLEALHYWVGQVDEAYDANTRDAVMAFQKVYGMDRTGRATDEVVAAVMATKEPPPALVPNGGVSRVEVDLDRQVMFMYKGTVLDVILPVSTGSNERFCSEGWCRKAVTPTGSFTIFQKDFGWETGPLGSLYNAQYFNGGIAVHGAYSVPGYPASHGCVRIPMSAAEWFPDRVIVGTPVYVVSGDDPHPRPVGPGATPVSTPTTIVADTVPAPTTTTTAPNLLSQLLAPPTTARRT